MPVIDADTHVDESESTWSALEQGPWCKYIPATVTVAPHEAARTGLNATTSRSWVVEGRLQNRAIRDDVNHPPRVFRELEDVPGRLAHMDRMGVDVQVIFPTFFIRYSTSNAEAEYALTTTYNRWMADKCSGTNGRLRWAAVLPWLQPEKAAEELRWAKANGACGIYKRGLDLERPVSDPHFFPVYEEADALDVPLCIHTGHPGRDPAGDRGTPIIGAFGALLSARIPEKFPSLRFGFIEAGASWLPYVLAERAAEKRQGLRGVQTHFPSLMELFSDVFRSNRFFITLDPFDDVEYLLKFGTEDSLMLGTDYSHTDISANLSAFEELQRKVEDGQLSEAAARKILETNPQRFYGL
ncbi:MAG TPA: amidohydrolase family protein [Chloroflexota bacterium]|nr:amidohydrolase family protein [Chloroflexota bacterium]